MMKYMQFLSSHDAIKYTEEALHMQRETIS